MVEDQKHKIESVSEVIDAIAVVRRHLNLLNGSSDPIVRRLCVILSNTLSDVDGQCGSAMVDIIYDNEPIDTSIHFIKLT